MKVKEEKIVRKLKGLYEIFTLLDAQVRFITTNGTLKLNRKKALMGSFKVEVFT